MENASKALIMAGSILIALLIIGALLLMFNNLSSYQHSNDINVKEAQVIEFNNQFTTYIRDNVRGNDLYSLLNRVIDYNKRKTIEGEQGAIEIGYQPMEIEFSLRSKDGKDQKALTIDGISRFFQSGVNDYIVKKADNTFEKHVDAKRRTLIDATYTEKVLTSLTTGITDIFLENSASDKDKKDAINVFNNITGLTISDYKDLQTGSPIREKVYTYYEYIQFKRANFDCTDSKYDENTGRIIYLKFQFNGKIQ